jgi:hypothetical protein
MRTDLLTLPALARSGTLMLDTASTPTLLRKAYYESAVQIELLRLMECAVAGNLPSG